MRQISGLEQLAIAESINLEEFSEIIGSDMAKASLIIEGGEPDAPVVLAKLCLLAEGLQYDRYAGKLNMHFAGVIDVSAVPLFYTLTGEVVTVRGRCSVLRSVCGVDWLLNSSYTAKAGDRVWQKFVLDLNKAFKQIKAG